MATVEFSYDVGGLTDLVVVLYRRGFTTMTKQSDGSQIARSAANLAAAAIPASDSALAGNYVVTIPAGMTASTYDLVGYRMRTNSATLVQADTLTPYGPEVQGDFEWDGTALKTLRAGMIATDAIDANALKADAATEIATQTNTTLAAAHGVGAWDAAGGGANVEITEQDVEITS